MSVSKMRVGKNRKWLIFGEGEDEVYLRVGKISFFRKMLWRRGSEVKYYTRIFLSADNHYYDEWEVSFEEVRDKILELSED